MKLWTTDAGFRVPGIMYWPGKITPGQVVSHPVSSLDFLPTFCELANATVPEDLSLDGTSFLPALENKAPERSKPLLWAFYDAINQRRVVMRDGDWKIMAKLSVDKLFLLNHENEAEVKAAKLSDFQLFKLTEDIGERNDLASSMPQKLAELKQRLETHYQELLEGSHIWDLAK